MRYHRITKNLDWYLIPRQKRATVTSVASQGTKRKADELNEEHQDDTVLSFKPQLRALKEHLGCAKHRGRFCFVQADGEHTAVGNRLLTLWAHKIVSIIWYSHLSLN